MHQKVRIQRNTLTFRQANGRILRVVEVFLGLWVKHAEAAERSKAEIMAARTEKIRMDTELAEMRRRHVMNQLVLDDLAIEKKNRELGHSPGQGIDILP